MMSIWDSMRSPPFYIWIAYGCTHPACNLWTDCGNRGYSKGEVWGCQGVMPGKGLGTSLGEVWGCPGCDAGEGAWYVVGGGMGLPRV